MRRRHRQARSRPIRLRCLRLPSPGPWRWPAAPVAAVLPECRASSRGTAKWPRGRLRRAGEHQGERTPAGRRRWRRRVGYARQLLQRPREIAGALPPIVGIFRERRANDPVEPWRRDAAPGRCRRRLTLENGGHRARRRLAGKRPRAGDHLVDHAPQREDVAPVIGVLALDLLRRHVVQRSEDRAGAGERRERRGWLRAVIDWPPKPLTGDAFTLANPKSSSFTDGAAPVASHDHDVGGLQIAVHDAGAMRPVERSGNLLRDGQRVVERKRTPGERVPRASRPRGAP